MSVEVRGWFLELAFALDVIIYGGRSSSVRTDWIALFQLANRGGGFGILRPTSEDEEG